MKVISATKLTEDVLVYVNSDDDERIDGNVQRVYVTKVIFNWAKFCRGRTSFSSKKHTV